MKSFSLSKFYEKYKHGIPVLLYMILYLTWWGILEQKNARSFQIIHMAIDDYIPFCELFIIPYVLWFFYVSIVVIYFFFHDRTEYYQALMFLFTGMTIFLVISTIWPNMHQLRLSQMPRDNIFTRVIAGLWATDTPTNLWPSIHVYNSLGAHFAIMKSKDFANKPLIRYASLLLAISIICSTVLIKQHSMFDVLTAFVMAAVMYVFVYRRDFLVVMKSKIKLSFNP
ncbi:MAG: serine/threonine protein phosphatase [Acetatifactor sp.]